MTFPSLDRFFNVALAKEPMNWAIVWTVASLWLLAFHVVMQAWGAMAAPATQGAFGGPGQVAPQAVPDVTTQFSVGGTLPMDPGSSLSPFVGNGGGYWTDGYETKYAEDGWPINA